MTLIAFTLLFYAVSGLRQSGNTGGSVIIPVAPAQIGGGAPNHERPANGLDPQTATAMKFADGLSRIEESAERANLRDGEKLADQSRSSLSDLDHLRNEKVTAAMADKTEDVSAAAVEKTTEGHNLKMEEEKDRHSETMESEKEKKLSEEERKALEKLADEEAELKGADLTLKDREQLQAAALHSLEEQGREADFREQEHAKTAIGNAVAAAKEKEAVVGLHKMPGSPEVTLEDEIECDEVHVEPQHPVIETETSSESQLEHVDCVPSVDTKSLSDVLQSSLKATGKDGHS